VLNAKHHGVPQNRERVFLIGIRDEKDNNFSFPAEEHLTKRLKDVLESEVDEKYFLSENQIKNIIKSEFTQEKERIQEGDYSGTLLSRDYKSPKCIKVIAFGRSEDEKKRRKEHFKKTGLDSGSFKDKELILKNQEYFDTLLANPNPQKEGLIAENYKIRRLTPRECFRLMDFPDSFTWLVSDSQAYKQAGNSIVVNVLYKILKNLSL
jgi:DNA (cytosine-5)-methyltransferase 1